MNSSHAAEFSKSCMHNIFFCCLLCHLLFCVVCMAGMIPLRVTPLKSFHKRLERYPVTVYQCYQEVLINLSACIGNHQLSSSPCGYNFCNMFLCTYVYQISKFMLGTFTVLGTDILSMGPQKPTKVKMIVHIIYLGRICKFVLD